MLTPRKSLNMMQQPSPTLFFRTINAYQQTQALKAAIELDVFTAIGKGFRKAEEIASWAKTSARGMRILCDYLVCIGFLTKKSGEYGLTLDSATFLDKASPAYLGGAVEFLGSPMLTDPFKDITALVRRGGTTLEAGGTVAPENPIWVKFARAMGPLMAGAAELTSRIVVDDAHKQIRVLDVAAGHGLFGIAVAKLCPRAAIVGLDWPNVVEVARENAEAAGVSERYETIAGDAFKIDLRGPYDVVLLPNILHHFDAATCESLFRRVHAVLVPGGRAVTIEFIPNDDRVTPPEVATFALMMLGTTPAGDAYTFAEFEAMARRAGFARSELRSLAPTLQHAVVSYK
jgi:ubiquinone/menaquinone biosynthesis C-methylase UbiE